MGEYEVANAKYRKKLSRLVNKFMRHLRAINNMSDKFDFKIYQNGVISFDTINKSLNEGIQLDCRINIPSLNDSNANDIYQFFYNNVKCCFQKTLGIKKVSYNVMTTLDGFNIQSNFKFQKKYIHKIYFHLVKVNSEIDIDYISFNKDSNDYSIMKYDIKDHYLHVKLLQLQLDNKLSLIKKQYMKEINNSTNNSVILKYQILNKIVEDNKDN